jgi:hypothetical protein
LIEPIHQPATKAPVQKTRPLDSLYQPPEPEPLFGTRKQQQYSFSRNDIPRTSIEPVLKTPPLDRPPSPETLVGAQKPQQYSFSRNDLPRTSIDQVHGPATKALVQKNVDLSLDSVYQPQAPEPPFARKPQQYSFSRNGLPGPLIENIYRPAVKITDQKTGEPCMNFSLFNLLNPKTKEPLSTARYASCSLRGIYSFTLFVDILKGGDDDNDDDIKDLDHRALRKLANQEMENMKKCRTEEKLAKRYRQLILARELVVKGRQHEKRMRELNERASEVVFASKCLLPLFRLRSDNEMTKHNRKKQGPLLIWKKAVAFFVLTRHQGPHVTED